MDEAQQVAYRITEILPDQNLAKQNLVELEEALTRQESRKRTWIKEDGWIEALRGTAQSNCLPSRRQQILLP